MAFSAGAKEKTSAIFYHWFYVCMYVDDPTQPIIKIAPSSSCYSQIISLPGIYNF
jgi:hypothetical protein